MDTITWSESYDYDAIDDFKKEHRKGPFVFVTEATVSKPRPDTLKVMYRMAVWLDGSVGEEVEPLLKKIGISAERIEGILGVNGTYRKWKCRKLSGLARVQKEGYIKLFELWTDESIRPRREDPRKDTFHLDIEVTFKPSRSHQEQIAHVLDLVFLKSTSHLGSAYDDSASLVSRPPNLALQIGPKQYVWVTEEELAAASPYLTKLVNAVSESGDATFARRSLDNRIDFDAVDDDSDDEEDTRRYKLIREREKWEELERARSPAPGPVEKKRRLDDADETASQSSNVSSCFEPTYLILIFLGRCSYRRSQRLMTKRIKRWLKLLFDRFGQLSWTLELPEMVRGLSACPIAPSLRYKRSLSGSLREESFSRSSLLSLNSQLGDCF